MKALQIRLCTIWLSGIFLIILSLYATQGIPSFKSHVIRPLLNQNAFSRSSSPKIAIFSAPSSFTGSVGARQALAIRSWVALSPDVTVVLFSQDLTVLSFANGIDLKVQVESNIDFTFLGTPFFHSMVARMSASTSDINVLIDSETILLPDFIHTMNFVHKLDHDWLLVASPRRVSNFSSHLDETGNQWLNKGWKKEIRTQKLREILSTNWQFNYCESSVLMAWRNGEQPLHRGVLPPFLYKRGIHNHWILNEAKISGYRFVFDATWAISSIYTNDVEKSSTRSVRKSNPIVHIAKNSSWECMGNSLIGGLYGHSFFYEANFSSTVRLLKCNDQYLFFDTKENIVPPFGSQNKLNSRERKNAACFGVHKSQEKILDCSLRGQLRPSISLELPFSFESLLSLVADKNMTIVLAIAGNSYKDMLMSWVCRLRRLRVTNFVICALDHDIYQFAILQGLPVFKDPSAPPDISYNDCHFGTKCFQRVTKMKSRIVLQTLKLGYNVLLSDVDVYWFQNPLPLLYSFGPSVLAAQSDEYNATGPINLPRRLNSGFYFARSDYPTIAALSRVAKHAANSDLSEQPSFYDTLCGEGGSNRVGDDRCFEPQTNLTVQFLDRNLFPNGAYLGLWERRHLKEACREMGCLIIHNNWISGRRKKLERQMSSGLWEYDSSTRMCHQTWQRSRFTSYF